MKTLVTILLALTGSLAIAQQHSSISRSINDDGKTLSIRLNGTVDGKLIDYGRRFDVSRLNRSERNALRERILDSLHVSVAEPPRPPQPPKPSVTFRTPAAPKAPIAPRPYNDNGSVAIVTSDGPVVYASGGDTQAIAVGGKHPYTKEVKYNSESGRLYLHYRFQKDGEEVNYERTINAPNKSQQDRQRIIEGIEKEIGVPTGSN